MFKELRHKIAKNFQTRNERLVKLSTKYHKLIYVNFDYKDYYVVGFSVPSFWDTEFGFFSVLGKAICNLENQEESEHQFQEIFRERSKELLIPFFGENCFRNFLTEGQKINQCNFKGYSEKYKQRIFQTVIGMFFFVKVYNTYSNNVDCSKMKRIIVELGTLFEIETQKTLKLEDLFENKNIFAIGINTKPSEGKSNGFIWKGQIEELEQNNLAISCENFNEESLYYYNIGFRLFQEIFKGKISIEEAKTKLLSQIEKFIKEMDNQDDERDSDMNREY